jgi:hypothetical protein
VFVASNTDHTVVVIDPKTGRPVGDPLPVPPNPWAVAAGAGHVSVSGIGAKHALADRLRPARSTRRARRRSPFT